MGCIYYFSSNSCPVSKLVLHRCIAMSLAQQPSNTLSVYYLCQFQQHRLTCLLYCRKSSIVTGLWVNNTAATRGIVRALPGKTFIFWGHTLSMSAIFWPFFTPSPLWLQNDVIVTKYHDTTVTYTDCNPPWLRSYLCMAPS